MVTDKLTSNETFAVKCQLELIFVDLQRSVPID